MVQITILDITNGIPPYSARGLKQTLKPIVQSSVLRRTINGGLLDIADSNFRKYESTITGDDQDAPAIENVWPGMQLIVDCIVEIVEETNTASESGTETDAGFSRTAVPGSIRHADGFTFYRPRLTMLVKDFNVQTDEYGATVSWSLSLEEV